MAEVLHNKSPYKSTVLYSCTSESVLYSEAWVILYTGWECSAWAPERFKETTDDAASFTGDRSSQHIL